MKVQWQRVVIGMAASVLFTVVGLGALIGLVIATSTAQSIQDVQSLRQYPVLSSIMIGLGCVWGAWVSLRGLPSDHTAHGLLIGLGVGLGNFVFNTGPFVPALFTLMMTLPAGVVGARLALSRQRRGGRS